MHQAFDAGLDLNERTVVGQVGDLAEQAGARRVTASDAHPRIFAELLHAQGDAVLLLVELQDLGGHFITNIEHFARVTDAAPCQVGDVQQTIDTAQVDECAVVGDVLDDTLDDGTFLEVFEQCLTLFTLAGFQHGAARNNDVVALAVELDDLEFEFLAFERGGVLDRTGVDQRARQEGADAVGHDGQTALDLASDDALDQGFVGEGLVQIVPGGDALGLVARQAGFAVAVFQHFDGDADVVARCGFDFTAVVLELIDVDEAFRLEAGVHDNMVGINANNFSGDDFAGAHFLALEAFGE